MHGPRLTENIEVKMQVKLLKNWIRFEGRKPGAVVDISEEDAAVYTKVGIVGPLEPEAAPENPTPDVPADETANTAEPEAKTGRRGKK